MGTHCIARTQAPLTHPKVQQEYLTRITGRSRMFSPCRTPCNPCPPPCCSQDHNMFSPAGLAKPIVASSFKRDPVTMRSFEETRPDVRSLTLPAPQSYDFTGVGLRKLLPSLPPHPAKTIDPLLWHTRSSPKQGHEQSLASEDTCFNWISDNVGGYTDNSLPRRHRKAADSAIQALHKAKVAHFPEIERYLGHEK